MKVDIVSGFLGAGKTTLIKKLIDGYKNSDKLAIIENEFGEVSIDGALLNDKNVDVREISSGCICCSIAGDFNESLEKIAKKYKPTRVIVEPSGVAKLSDIIKNIKSVDKQYNLKIDHIVTLIDIMNFHMYLNNFGEFYKDQIRNAKTLICTRCDLVDFNYEGDIIKQIAKINNNASIITAQLDDISFNELEDVLNIQYDKKNKITKAEKGVFKIHNLGKKVAHGVFQSWGIETNKLFKKFELQKSFEKISSFNEYGNILRGKGIVCIGDNNWMEFHYTPGFFKIEKCKPQKNSKIVVIGQDINKEKLEKLFA